MFKGRKHVEQVVRRLQKRVVKEEKDIVLRQAMIQAKKDRIKALKNLAEKSMYEIRTSPLGNGFEGAGAKPSPDEHIGLVQEFVRLCRMELGWDGESPRPPTTILARILGVSPGMISSAANGRRVASLDYVVRTWVPAWNEDLGRKHVRLFKSEDGTQRWIFEEV